MKSLFKLFGSRKRQQETAARHIIQQVRTARPPACPTCNGKGGHPIVLDGSLLDELLDINEETLGIKAVVQRHGESVRRVELGIPEILWDMNTPEQYEAVLKAAT